MKKILGLDLGTTSIGWAYVNEADNESEKSSIIKLGVRVIPLTTDEETDFQKGKAISINADRTLKRGARRNLNRYQLRRDTLIEVLKKKNIINDVNVLTENGKNTTHTLWQLRAKAAKEKISKDDFAKVLLMINKKRGYKSSRKAKSEEEGTVIDGMEVAKYLYENNLTPGQYVYELLKNDKKYIPDFYRSDLQNEFNKIWNFQKRYYPEILSDELKENLKDKNKGQTWKICEKPFNIKGVKLQGKPKEQKMEKYKLRTKALLEQLDLEYLAIVFQEINNQINNSSGYLGAISDRSKELYFGKLTIGEYLYNQLKENKHTRLKNQVFYRQDYLDEFERIWEIQKEFYSELTDNLKSEVRDVIIFYQRRLKSQKHLISFCEFEKRHRVIPKSSPLFQEFRIWQNLNNLIITDKKTNEKYELDIELKKELFKELNIKRELKAVDVLKIIGKKSKDFELNFGIIQGNRTNAELYKVYQKILEFEGEDYDFRKMKSDKINDIVSTKFLEIGINTDILSFDAEKKGNDFDKQAFMQLWHMLYSFEGDNSVSGNEKLIKKLNQKFGFKKEYAKLIASISLQADYGNLSSKAIRKILPYLREGNKYDVACAFAGYNHSSSQTKEQNESRELKKLMELLPKNSLRNPVVEKILNQLVNLVNAIIEDEDLGKPDEIRIELARELKKSAKERAEMTSNINKATARHEKIRKLLQTEFGISKVTRNDIIKYKLWEELEKNGYKTLYTNTYIPKHELFSKKFDIEHIIPKTKLFDDSFSNKTLSVRQVNIKKSNDTAYDFIKNKYSSDEFENYIARIKMMYKEKAISRAKYNKLMMKNTEIPDEFIDRDLRNSQYIAKKAKQMLEEVVRTVNTTTGKITDRLRRDWQLVNVMKELNLPKYEKLGLVEFIEGKNGQPEKRIKGWTKRNDHRHHAMDALTVAFTSYSHVQYLNNMSARNNEAHKKYHTVYGIEKKYLYRDKNNKLLFKSPMPIDEFRRETKKHLENILVSFKAKNKVVTRNKNKIKIKGKDNYKIQEVLTPRGQLHKETVYGKIQRYETKFVKIGTKFDLEMINKVAEKKYREALLKRLNEFDGNPQKAFGGKNAPSKKPVYISETEVLPEKVKTVWKEDIYTIRKDITPDLKIDKIIDVKIKNILKHRLEKFDNNAKEAFSNLEKNPIWLNKDKGISIKRVTITGVSNAEALHYKKDHKGQFILDKNGDKIPVDFVSTGNNHHVAIYKDEQGNLQEEVVSFYEAVHRVNQKLPVIMKNHPEHPDWVFQFSMKQNEYFVFPSDNFDPNEIDLLNPENANLISPHLFRMQKFSKVTYGNSAVRDYVFRHHMETQIVDKKETKNVTYIVAKSLSKLKGVVKVRINHLGKIVEVGEY